MAAIHIRIEAINEAILEHHWLSAITKAHIGISQYLEKTNKGMELCGPGCHSMEWQVAPTCLTSPAGMRDAMRLADD